MTTNIEGQGLSLPAMRLHQDLKDKQEGLHEVIRALHSSHKLTNDQGQDENESLDRTACPNALLLRYVSGLRWGGFRHGSLSPFVGNCFKVRKCL